MHWTNAALTTALNCLGQAFHTGVSRARQSNSKLPSQHASLDHTVRHVLQTSKRTMQHLHPRFPDSRIVVAFQHVGTCACCRLEAKGSISSTPPCVSTVALAWKKLQHSQADTQAQECHKQPLHTEGEEQLRTGLPASLCHTRPPLHWAIANNQT